MIEAGNGIGIDQVVLIGIEDQIIDVDLSVDMPREKDLNMVRITEEETSEEHKIIEDKPLEGNIEETMGIVILIGVEAG